MVRQKRGVKMVVGGVRAMKVGVVEGDVPMLDPYRAEKVL
jgi:hypothetical protein